MIKTIVARSKNNVIGVGNDIPWHLKEDFKYFKEQTTNNIILMGRNTVESIKKTLPNRESWAVSSKETQYKTFKSVKNAVDLYHTLNDGRDLFFCGGTKIYESGLEYSDELIITEVNLHVEKGTAFFNIHPESCGFYLSKTIYFVPGQNTEALISFSINHYLRKK